MYQSHTLQGNPALLVSTLGALRAAAADAFPMCASALNVHLTDSERRTLEFANSLPLSEGSWYRPFHNLLVTMAMIRICESVDASRDLVTAAILHDIGYSAIEIPSTLQGPAWDTRDVRLTHMAVGRTMSEEYIRKSIRDGTLVISEERLQKILDIIATHDNPYIGKPLSDSEALFHRDADRLFVISCTSFWKDYIALLSEPTKLKRFQDIGVAATPQALLTQRHLSFFRDASSPLSAFTVFEPMQSDYAQRFVQWQYSSRSHEIPSITSLIHAREARPAELQDMFKCYIVNEFKALAQ